MKMFVKSVLSGACVSAACSLAVAQSAQIPGWRMVWNEEFTGTTLNTARWHAENVAWPYNAELEYYLPQQATVRNSLLDIKAERRNFGGRNYVSARIDTSNSFSQQYGRFEARIKVPGGQGYWPAFWLLPATGAWPPEIDIVETIGSRPNTVYMTHHWGTASNVMSNGITWDGPNFTAGYHRFAVEWSPTKVDWLVDNVVRFTTVGNFPQEPMFIILNLAIGGVLPGNPNAQTVFPQSMLVDWVRVYQRDLPLLNPSFETLAAGVPTGWQLFGNIQPSTTWAKTGTNSLKVFSVNGSLPFYSGAFQDLPATAGQVWTASGVFRNRSADQMFSSNFVDLKIEWYNHLGQQLGSAPVQALSSSSPIDTDIPVSVTATAPPGTASARIAAVFVQQVPSTNFTAGYFDDLSFSYSSPVATTACPADFNGITGVGVQDIFDFLAAWFASDPRADFNDANGIGVQDIFDFLSAWFQGCP